MAAKRCRSPRCRLWRDIDGGVVRKGFHYPKNVSIIIKEIWFTAAETLILKLLLCTGEVSIHYQLAQIIVLVGRGWKVPIQVALRLASVTNR